MQGERYFSCQANHGLFVKTTLVKPDTTPDDTPPPTAATITSPPSPSTSDPPPSHSRKPSSSAAPRSPNVHLRPSISTKPTPDDSKSRTPASPRSPRSPRSPSKAAPAPSPSTSTPLAQKREELLKLQHNRQQLQHTPEATPPSPAPAAVAPSTLPPSPAAAIDTDTVSAEEYRLLAADLTKAKQVIHALQAQEAAAPAAVVADAGMSAEVERLRGEVESLELDRELKEEEGEELRLEMEELKARLDVAEAELRDAREAEGKRTGELMASLAVTAEQKEAVRLLEQNAQLTQALSRLRDVMLSDKERYRLQHEELSEEVRLLREVEEESVGLKRRVERLQVEVSEYREQLDEYSEYAQMVETLTDKNLHLSDERRALSERVHFLQNLNEASEEVEESHIELEATLSAELEAKERELGDVHAKLRYRAMQVEEGNKVVRQFRELVRSMEAELKALREREVSRSVGERVRGGESHQQQWGAQSVLLLSQLKELRVKTLKEQLAAVDADESRQRFDFVLHYLPDNVSVDERSIDTTTAVARIRGKLTLLYSTVLDYYTSRQVYAKNDDLAVYAYHLLLLLLETQRMADFLHSTLPLLTAEQWETLTSALRELLQVEGDIDSYLSLIEQDAVNEMTGVSSLVHAYESLRELLVQRVGVEDVGVEGVVGGVREEGSGGVMPFSVGGVWVMRRYARLADAKAQQAREEAQDAQLTRLTQAIETKTVHCPPSSLLPLTIDGRFLLCSSQLLSALLEQVGDAVQVLSTARKEGRLRAEKIREIERGEREEKKEGGVGGRGKEVAEVEGGGVGGEEEDEGEYHRLYLQLEDVNGNVQQIAQQIVQTAMGMSLAGRVVQRGRREEVVRLIYLAGLRVQRCVSEMTQLSAHVKTAVREERVEKVKRIDAVEEERLIVELAQLLQPHVLPASSSSSALNLSHELNQLKATMLELTRALAGTEDAPPPPSTLHPSLAAAHAVRLQLESSAALRVQLQELQQKMSERQRELVSLKTREQEQVSKISVLQAKLTLLHSKLEGVEGQRVELDDAHAQLNLITAQLQAAVAEAEKHARDNKALRKQLLKLKHATSKLKPDDASPSSAAAGGGGGAAVLGSADALLLQQTVRQLRLELLQARGQRAKEALLFDIPALGVERKAGLEEADGAQLRAMRGQLLAVQRRLFDFRTQAKVVDLTGDSEQQTAAEKEERKEKHKEDTGQEEKTHTPPPTFPSLIRSSPAESEHLRRIALLGQLRVAKQLLSADLTLYVERKRTQRYMGPLVTTPTPPP